MQKQIIKEEIVIDEHIQREIDFIEAERKAIRDSVIYGMLYEQEDVWEE